MQRLLPILAVSALAALSTAQTIVIPNGTATVEGNTSNAFPWGRGGTGLLQQCIYDASNFTLQGITYPIIITGLRWRPNTNVALVASSYTSGCSVNLSTAPFGAGAAPSATLASNRGANQQNCYTGVVSWNAQAAQVGPTPFGIAIPFTSNFLYDPAAGDLNIECDLPIQTFTGTGPQLDVQSTGSLSSRVFVSTGYPGTGTGSITANHGVVVEVAYMPATGLFAGFSANVQGGVSPLAVQFTDSSFSSTPGGITSWAWDFDGDTIIDSTLQNPSHVYNACGTYTVSLTVNDGAFPASTETKTNYIAVDAISPSFTASVTGGFAPVNVQFTDTSTGPVVAWLWDLDGDTIIDSALQNPTWVYNTPGNYTVTLNIINACNNLTLTRTNLITVLAPGSVPAAPEILAYQFNEVRGTTVANVATTAVAPAQGIMNNATWQADPNRPLFRGNEAGFGCLGFRTTGGGQVNTGWTTSVTGSFSVSFWLRKDPTAAATPFGYPFGNGTFRSFVGGAAGSGITFRGTAIGNVNSGFTVNGTPGVWQHLTLVVDDAAGQALWYDNGSPSATVVAFTPNTFSYSSAILLAVGAISTTSGSQVVVGYDMDDFRMYSRALLPAEVLVNSLLGEHASAGSAGSFCDGPGGTPVISGNGVPSIGNASFAVNLSNAEDNRLAAIVFGFTPAAFGTFSLAPWIGAGCELQTDNVGATFHITASNAASQSFVIPGNNAFQGLHVYGQWVILGTQGAATRLLDINIH